ncbi:MAG: glycosyltransferase family 9 protein [Candidatus Vecturithrix sp.]|nr:glycosyltransferase family 9 protein [Candidatus Vecturithrix sp.]
MHSTKGKTVDNRHIQNIIIIRFSSFGDIVLTTPLVRALRTRFPDARIDFVVKQEFAELLSTNPHLTTVYPFRKKSGVQGLYRFAQDLRRNHYDLCIDIHANFRSYLLRCLIRPTYTTTWTRYLLKRLFLVKAGINRYFQIIPVPDRYLHSVASFGVVNDGKGLEIFPDPQHETRVQAIFAQACLADQDLAIGFGAVAAHPLKQWPLEKFIQLGQQLIQRQNARILLFGGPADLEQARELANHLPNHPIVLCGKLSLLESAAALRRCAVFVGNDTGTVHLAAAMKRPVVVIFGPTVEEFGFYPYTTRATVISTPLSCRPCTHTGKGRCKIRETHACMQRIEVTEVLTAVEQKLYNITEKTEGLIVSCEA